MDVSEVEVRAWIDVFNLTHGIRGAQRTDTLVLIDQLQFRGRFNTKYFL